MSIKENITHDLEQTNGWVCGARWLSIPGGYVYSQRVSELNRKGLEIQSRRCTQHGHRVYEYHLVRHPQQLRLVS